MSKRRWDFLYLVVWEFFRFLVHNQITNSIFDLGIMAFGVGGGAGRQIFIQCSQKEELAPNKRAVVFLGASSHVDSNLVNPIIYVVLLFS